jgi:hypothetical protein
MEQDEYTMVNMLGHTTHTLDSYALFFCELESIIKSSLLTKNLHVLCTQFGSTMFRHTVVLLQVYCNNVIGKHAMSAPFQHLSEDYNQHEDIFSGNPELFYDFGGVAAWRDFIKALTDTRGPAPWTFSPSARRINSTNLPV